MASSLPPPPSSSTPPPINNCDHTPTKMPPHGSFSLSLEGSGGVVADAPPKLPSTTHRTLRQKATHLWHGLPTAAKTTLILAVVGSVLLIAYGITAVNLKSYDEEAHIATIVIVMSIFILYSTFDAVIYENTLQLIIAIILTALMLARVLWFVSTRPTSSTLLPLKIIWGSVIALVELAFIISAFWSCREFGWRLYSRLGVDYRRKGAEGLQRLAWVAHAFNALVKLDLIFLVTVTALGIDVSFEKQAEPDGSMLGCTIATFVVGTAVAVWGVITASTVDEKSQQRRMIIFDSVAWLSFAGPIAMIVNYHLNETDVANAYLSLVIACSVFMAVRAALWVTLHLVVRNMAKMKFVGGRIVVRIGGGVRGTTSTDARMDGGVAGAEAGEVTGATTTTSAAKDGIIATATSAPVTEVYDALLASLQEGAWLGKPAPRNPHKLRFFQLSQDGTTLRWGWKKFVRLYYVDEVVSSLESMSLTLTFLLDPELVLRFQDVETLEVWSVGLKHAIAMLLQPDGGPRMLSSGVVAGGGHQREEEGEDVGLTAVEEGRGGFASSLRTTFAKTFSKSRTAAATLRHSSSSGSGGSSGGNSNAVHQHQGGEDGAAVVPSPTTPTPSQPRITTPSSGQLQKRQRMAAFLAAAAATVGRIAHPIAGTSGGASGGGGGGGGASASGSGSGRLRGRQRQRWVVEDVSVGMDDEDSIDVRSGGEEEQQQQLQSRRKKQRTASVKLVSVGTQTDDTDFSDNVATPPPPLPAMVDAHTHTSSGGDDAYLASQYAALMAAAAADHPGGGVAPPLPPPNNNNNNNSISTTSTTTTPLTLGFGGGRHQQAPPHDGTTTMTPLSLSSPTSPSAMLPLSSPTSPPLAISVDVVDFDDLSIGKLLGAGSEGAVYAAWYMETPVAVKRFNRVEDSLHEVGMYLGVGSHDNVVGLRALCQHEGAMFLILEYCPRGTLDAMLHHSAPLQWDPARMVPFVRSIARGMHHLHARGIVHRDLKPANIFVGHGQTMKVGDFGMARYLGPAPHPTSTTSPPSSPQQQPPNLVRLSPGIIGTSQYAAPELINDVLRPDVDSDVEWAMKVDVWSFGVTLWEVIERKRPFEGMSQVGMESMWLNNPYQSRLPAVKVPETMDAGGKRILRGLSDLVEDCTRLDPMERPTFGTVLRRLRRLGGETNSTGGGGGV